MSRQVKFFLLAVVVLAMLFAVSCGDDDDDDNNDDATPDDDDTADDDTVVDDDDDDDNDNNDDTTPDDDDTAPDDEVTVTEDGDDLVIGNSRVSVRYHLTAGRYSVLDAEGTAIVDHAEVVVYSHVLVPKNKWYGSQMPLIEWTSEDAANALGEGMSITVTRGGRDDAPTLVQTFTLLDNLSCVLSSVDVLNTTGKRIKVGAIYLLYAEPPDGTLNFGDDRDLRILTNGYLNYLDFVVPLYPGTMPTISNWSTLIYNQKTDVPLALGFLSFEMAEPIVYNGPPLGQDGYSLQAVCQYEPSKRVARNDSLTSEPMILDFGQATPQLALETYADRLKIWLDIQTWLDRHPEIGVPVGWNSWSGSSSSGGYGTGIDEEIICDNMDFADRELRKWGMNYFQIDDGWEPTIGDWEVNATRFPDHGAQNGIEWLLSRADNLGFIPGIWIQMFNASPDSQTLADHPDWFAGQLLNGLIPLDEYSLDLTNPDTQDYITDTMEMLKDWGAEWIKLDFAYRAVISEDWHEPNITRGEFYRSGVKTVREALGDDVFFLNVAIVGWNIGLIDSSRLTLDTMPVWEGESEHPYVPLLMFDNQGLKPMYRDCARRYYLHNRVWINHPDLTFFRAHAEPQFPPLTLNESQTFVAGVALQGGIVKIGDRIVDLTEDGVSSLRQILPVYGEGARPLDLMQREFPEIWSLSVDDFDEPYHVLGLLNWGLNRDLTKLPYQFIADAPRDLSVDLAEAGLDTGRTYLAFEFYTQEYLGEVTDEFTLEVPASTPRMVALREKLDRPQFLGTNRHVMGGVQVVHSVAWDDEDDELIGVQEGAIGTTLAPFTHQLSVYAPAGFTAAEAEVGAPAGYAVENVDLTQDGNVVTLTFDVVETKAPEAGEMHPDVTWTISF